MSIFLVEDQVTDLKKLGIRQVEISIFPVHCILRTNVYKHYHHKKDQAVEERPYMKIRAYLR